jgi:hypothetical protein
MLVYYYISIIYTVYVWIIIWYWIHNDKKKPEKVATVMCHKLPPSQLQLLLPPHLRDPSQLIL